MEEEETKNDRSKFSRVDLMGIGGSRLSSDSDLSDSLLDEEEMKAALRKSKKLEQKA